MPSFEELSQNAQAYAETDESAVPVVKETKPVVEEKTETTVEVVEEPADNSNQVDDNTSEHADSHDKAPQSNHNDSDDSHTTKREEEPQNRTQRVSEPSRRSGKGSSARQVSSTDANIIIKISESIEKLNASESVVANKLLAPDLENPTRGELVVSVMNTSDLVRDTINSILEAKELDPVERAFYVVEMDHKRAVSMASMVSAFEGGDALDGSHSQVDIARQVVAQIDKMPKEDFDYIRSTMDLLDFAEGIIEDSE